MKRNKIFILTSLLAVLIAVATIAQDRVVNIYSGGAVINSRPTSQVDSVLVAKSATSQDRVINILYGGEVVNSLPESQVDSIKVERAQDEPDDGSLFEFGYCGEKGSNNLKFGAGTHRVLMEIPAEQADVFAGAKIKKVSFVLEKLASQSAKVVILNKKEDETPVYTQDVTIENDTWNEVTLTVPYTISKEGFFIGYEVEATASDYPLGLDDGPVSSYGDIVGYKQQGTDSFIFLHMREYGGGNNCIRIYLSGYYQVQYDLALKTLDAKDIVKPGEEFNLTGTVKNTATKDINSYDVTCQIGSQTPVTKTINKAVKAGETATFDIAGLKVEQEGTYDIKVTISNLDGRDDEDMSDNTMSKEIVAMKEFIPRKILLEQFSTQSCSNCPAAHVTFKSVTSNRSDIAWVVHHAAFGTDQYTIDESEDYVWFYEGDDYAPAAMLDRTCLGSAGAPTPTGGNAPTPVFFPKNLTTVENLVDYCLEQPAAVSVNISDSYNAQTREYTVTVSGDAVINFNKEVRVNIFLTEDGLKGFQAGSSNSNYDHSHAMRKVMTGTWGTPVTFDNKKYEVTFTCTLDEGWVPSNMNVIAFLSYYDANDKNACQVLNTNWKELNAGM